MTTSKNVCHYSVVALTDCDSDSKREDSSLGPGQVALPSAGYS